MGCLQRVGLIAGTLSCLVFGQEEARLPIKRVVLYKNGVGYFEHLGRVQGDQKVEVSFTSSQLNDVLKSLTVLDLNGGRITGVGYGSTAPMERRLGDLRLPLGEQNSLTEILKGLRGARIEVRNGGAAPVTGRLLSVERKTRMNSGATLEVDYLSLLGEDGNIRTIEVSPSFGFKLLDPGLAGKVSRLLDIVSAGREPDERHMTISTAGTGDRNLFVSYISEVPVWKATYRVVLNSKPGMKPLLQGWAVVDNTVGQNWENVQLSLVAGAPQSFVQNVSQPVYAKRPVVDVATGTMMAPQTHQAPVTIAGSQLLGQVVDAAGGRVPGAVVTAYNSAHIIVGTATSDAEGIYRFDGLPRGPLSLETSANGFVRARTVGIILADGQSTRKDVTLQVGSVAERVEVRDTASTLQTESTSLARERGIKRKVSVAPPPAPVPEESVGQARTRMEAASTGQELGDLFEYKLKDPVTIEKNRSSLVPIIHSPVGAEKVSLWNDEENGGRLQRCLWLHNTSGLTLDGGSFTVLEEETFAGEGIFEPIRPDERRLISFAIDLGVTASAKTTSHAEPVRRARIIRGTLWQERETRETKVYTLRNEDTHPRVIVVEHKARPAYELASDVKPVETSGGYLRFRLHAEPKQTVTLPVVEVRRMETSFAVTNITANQLATFVSGRTIDGAIETALRRVIESKTALETLEDQAAGYQEERERIFSDQERLRENMKALKGSAEEKVLLQRYTQQLNEQENRLEALLRDEKRVQGQVDQGRDALAKLIEELSFDVKL